MHKFYVDVKCKSCRGRGIIHGSFEPEGVAVVCIHCKGTGCKKLAIELEEEPFDQRMILPGITTVKVSAFLPEGRVEHEGITYEDFLRGKLP